MRVERRSPCKVNFILNILGRRPDGFHEVETVLYPVGVYDELEFAREGAIISLTCNNSSLPTDRGNLVYRAAEIFLSAAGIKEGVRIHLEKKLPLAAGLGGGSANAAVTLAALNELFGKPLPESELVRLAASLGSDVPFFLQNKAALGLGRGEQIEVIGELAALRGHYILLVHPGFGISTPWAYKNLVRFPLGLNGEAGRAKRLIDSLRTGDLSTAANDFYNSLEFPALEKYPLLVLFQEFFRSNGAYVSLMSGSGSTTFALIEGEAKAQRMLEKFHGEFGDFCWTALVPCES